MQLEGTLDLERKRVQRWVPIVAIVVPVFLFVAATTWFIRAFIAPPMAAIPAPMKTATISPPAQAPPAAPQVAPRENAAVLAYAGATEPTSAATLPMFGSFALAPPGASLRTAPPATVEPEQTTAALPADADNRSVAPTVNADFPPATSTSTPRDVSHGETTAALEPAIADPVPLPPQRRQLSSAQTESRVPLPRARPIAEEAPPVTTEAERRMFSAHGAE
jgi:hypothetical protein